MKRLAAALEVARTTRSRIGKEQALAAAFRSIASPDTPDASDSSPAESSPATDLAMRGLATAARLATGLTLPVGDGRSLGVGGSLMTELAVQRTGEPPDVLWTLARRTGDLGEAFGELVERQEGAADRPGVPLHEVAELFDALAATGVRAQKLALLEHVFARATPLETKYLAKVILGSLRVGALGGVTEAAIARAFGVALDDVRRAMALATDPGVVVVLAKEHRLHEARFELGRPVAYMLATPLENVAQPIDPGAYVLEDKLDGVRAQLHKSGETIALFARGLDRVTTAFPEVVEAFRAIPTDVVLDGELVAMTPDFRPRPFQALQARLRRLAPTAAMIEKTPVTFVAFDVLYEGSSELLSATWLERRAALDRFTAAHGPRAGFMVNPTVRLRADEPLPEQLDRAFDEARGRGHEGLVLKKLDAPYEAGRRGQAWIKVKRAFATLDVVITAAEEGHGKRAGVLSDYTFGVWKDDALVNVGKAYSGLTDVEIDQMTQRLQALTVEQHGGLRLVRPEIVLEVAFDGIQRSTRHASGFALRFPRIVRIRDDKLPDLADRLEAVQALFAAQVETGHREEPSDPPPAEPPAAPAPRAPRRKKSKASPNQLSLFGTPGEVGASRSAASRSDGLRPDGSGEADASDPPDGSDEPK
ncbi:ATP-dependent DNA ligase [Pendulispora albinea]|uniref:DNA ligase n=1 Tax=Pendulispora albinea TaxID=2741071 RepID=A0ABZ2M3K6_9BACT